ncbi:MAG TPA: sulfotransferase, partial [Actinomycetota bacterium]|nr:sulfotransferase [Actinomycetota bacterium]
ARPRLPVVAAPFFVVGSARSGTTLLRVILNSHPDVAVPPESRFVTELWRGKGEVDRDVFLNALHDHRQFQAWDLPMDAVIAELSDAPRLAYRDAVAGAYVAYSKAHGKSRWGDKTPRYVLRIPFLADLFPDSRFIHLVRDGRNVALSYAGMPFGPKTVPKAATIWSQRVMAGVRDGRPLGDARYTEVLYESFVADTEGHVRKLCDFLELDFDPAMLDYADRARDFVFEKAARYNPHVLEKPRTDVRSWKDEMPDRQVELFEAVAGDVLSEFGYPRRFENPSASAKMMGRLGTMGLPVGRLARGGDKHSTT